MSLLWGGYSLGTPHTGGHPAVTGPPGLGLLSGTFKLRMEVKAPSHCKMPQGYDSGCELIILRVPWFQCGPINFNYEY